MRAALLGSWILVGLAVGCSGQPGDGTGTSTASGASSTGTGGAHGSSSGGRATSTSGGSTDHASSGGIAGTSSTGTTSSGSTGDVASSGGSSASSGGNPGSSSGGTGGGTNCDGQNLYASCTTNVGSQDSLVTCDDGVCVLTSCQGWPSEYPCAAGADAGVGSCCANACASLADTSNCGGCGITCAVGAQCTDARCSGPCADGGCAGGLACVIDEQGGAGAVCLTTSCASDGDDITCATGNGGVGVCCSGTCVDDTTPQNCGACGNACASGVCTQGSCLLADCASAPDDYPCGTGGAYGFCCSQSCVDPDTDPANCGNCGNACGSGEVCDRGTCRTTVSCSTASPGEVCQQPGGLAGSCCAGGCIDVGTDPDNCGQCGVACSAGASCVSGGCVGADGGPSPCGPGAPCRAGWSCVGGACLPQACTPSTTLQPCAVADAGAGTCCGGTACTDVTSDGTSCGGCGDTCPVGEVCKAGSCTEADGGTTLGCYFASSACPTGTQCGSGWVCAPTTCPAGLSGPACAFGEASVEGTCCAGSCVATTQDPANCGGCGIACPSGLCTTPEQGFGSGECLPQIDDAGCPLGCGTGTVCINGGCYLTSGCSPGTWCATSDGTLGVCCFGVNGTACADPANDPANCGGCGLACPRAQTCLDGVCSGAISPCEAGRNHAYCDLDAGPSWVCCPGGGCADLETDSANCGGCGYTCASGFACATSQCLATDCASVPAGSACPASDGVIGQCCGSACVDVSTDPQDCGRCGASCAGSESCRQGACGLDQCSAPAQGDPCHFDAGDGTLVSGACCSSACVNVQGDPLNCGGCGLACRGDGGCAQGSCS